MVLNLPEHRMATHTPHKTHRTHGEDAEIDPEPGMLPVEPDEGMVQPAIPTDPEHDRLVDPEA